MARIKQRQADFGASDVIAPQAALAKDGLVMFPTVVSGIVPVVNLRKGGAPLKLSGEVLARIFLGEISHWQAPRSWPSTRAWPAERADPRGVPERRLRLDHHFSDYLSKVSPAWKARFGVASKHPWPEGFIAVKGSGEVSKTVRSTPGAIGYIDYSYVVEDALTRFS
jgi:phosphate transport system substrate-binding protein